MQEQIPQQLDDTEEPQAVTQIIRENDLPSLHDEEEPAAMVDKNIPQLPAVRPGKLPFSVCQCSRNHLLALKIQNFSSAILPQFIHSRRKTTINKICIPSLDDLGISKTFCLLLRERCCQLSCLDCVGPSAVEMDLEVLLQPTKISAKKQRASASTRSTARQGKHHNSSRRTACQ